MESKGIFCRFFICIAVLSFLLYSYVDQQNDVTRLRLNIPQLAKEIKDLREENTRLQYQIDLFESPQNLMQLASSAEFSHLKHPMAKDIVTLDQGLALRPALSEKEQPFAVTPKLPLAVNSRH